MEVTLYIVYAPESPDVLLDGECTSTPKAGVLACHVGPASIRCLSASPRPNKLSLVRSSSDLSNKEAELSSFL